MELILDCAVGDAVLASTRLSPCVLSDLRSQPSPPVSLLSCGDPAANELSAARLHVEAHTRAFGLGVQHHAVAGADRHAARLVPLQPIQLGADAGLHLRALRRTSDLCRAGKAVARPG